MSEENTTTTETTTEPTKDAAVSRIDKENVWLERGEFREGDLEGVGFYFPQIKSLKQGALHFTSATANGDEVICGLVNSELAKRARNKAKSKLPEDDSKRADFIEKCGRILISADEAFEFSPGERELTSDVSLLKAQKENMKLSHNYNEEQKKFRAAGQIAEADSLLNKAKFHMTLARKYRQQLDDRATAEMNLD